MLIPCNKSVAMQTKIISYRAGFTNVYLLINNGSCLLIDTGSRGESGKIVRWIKRSGYAIDSLKYIFLTHTHYDHAGSAAELKNISGAKVIVHASEAGFLENGFTPIPKGTSALFKFISWAGKYSPSIEEKVAGYPRLKPEIIFKEELDLQSFGFDAKITHTPGHTLGSSSLLLDDQAFVGDCMFNMRGTIYPGFADDEVKLRNTWSKILNWEVKWFFPSHGKRFSIENFKESARRKNIQ
jgi:hydroxyacylglutathione hydrolase